MATATEVTIGSKLPNDLILKSPLDPNDTVTIRGLHSSKLHVPYVTTRVSVEFWGPWVGLHKDFQPLKTGAIFEAKNEDAAREIARDRSKIKTGLEGMPRDAEGIKPRNDKD